MAALAIEFASKRHTAGYRVQDGLILPIGSRRVDVRPLAHHASLYLQFAALDDRPQSFADFMGTFGPVTHDGGLGGESVKALAAMRGALHRLIEMAARDPSLLLRQNASSAAQQRAIGRSWARAIQKAQGGEAAPTRLQPSFISTAAAINAVLRPGAPDGRPTLCLVPDQLWDAMILQFMQAVGGDGAIRACQRCGTWFEVGGPTGKRADARFCSDACRLQTHQQKAKGATSGGRPTAARARKAVNARTSRKRESANG